MRCPFCQSLNTYVVDSRTRNEATTIWRRRKCLSCGRRFSTREQLDLSYLMVIKKNGQKEPFSREKILLGMTKSFGKHQIPEQKLEEVVDGIIQDIHKIGVSQIKSELIGNLVLEKLYKLDLVAYIRFASVFKKFKDIESFNKELAMLSKKQKEAKGRK
jgi:transcriptional repressor NrdR